MVNGELVVSNYESSPKIMENIDQWTDAFHIFNSIFFEKHPSEINNFLQYIANVREAAQKHTG